MDVFKAEKCFAVIKVHFIYYSYNRCTALFATIPNRLAAQMCEASRKVANNLLNLLSMSSSLTVSKTFSPGTPIIIDGSTLTFYPARDFVYSIDCGNPKTATYIQDTLATASNHLSIELTITFKSE